MRQVGLRRGFSSALALVLAAWVGSCGSGDDPKGPGREAVDFGGVQGSLATNKTTVWVVMKAKADLKAAPEIKNHAARGKFVVDKLQAAAKQSQAGVVAFVKGKGLQHRSYWIINTIRVTVDDATAKELSLRPDVERIVPDGVMNIPEPTPSEAGSTLGATWGVAKIGADLVWNTYGMGEGIVIGSIDTGVDYTHPALVAHYRGNAGGGNFSHDYNWFDPANVCVPAGVPCDNNSHGTHTMGTILGGDGIGPSAEDIGVAPGAKWIAAKGCESGSCSYSSLLSSGEFMLAPLGDASKRPHIISNSWGGGAGDTFFQPMVQSWVLAGIFPVFANGNGGPTCGSVGSPGDYPESFGVGATDSVDGIASFSSRGPSSFGVIKPDVSAPGVDVRSSVPGGGYASYNGTSMATPHVAGVVALVWQAAPSLAGEVASTAELLRATAVNLGDMTCGGDLNNNNVFGEGRIDALKAVQQAPRLAGTLEGTVTAEPGGPAIVGATIRATPLSGYPRTTTTDSNGNFSMVLAVDAAPEPEPGTRAYEVTATAFGYVTGTASPVDIVEGSVTTTPFALTTATPHQVTGLVKNELGVLVAGVRVEAVGTPITSQVTGANGAYSLDLPAGSYSLRTKDRCHDAATVPVVVGVEDVVKDIAVQTHYDAFGYHCEVVPYYPGPIGGSLGLSGDDAAATVSLPFPFQFYGKTYSKVYPSTNGLLNFQGLNTDYANGTIPSTAVPNAAIYAFWDDLIVSALDPVRATVTGIAPNRVWVIAYPSATYYGDTVSPPITFQVKLFEAGGVVEVHYGAMAGRGDGRSASIGIEDAAGTVGLQYARDEAVILSDTALRFIPPATIRMDSGSTSPYLGWGPDQAYTVGVNGYTNTKSTTTVISAPIANTTDDLLYQTLRNSPGDYKFDRLAVGQYEVELRFVEPTATKSGIRVFDLYVEGLGPFEVDIFASAGGKQRAHDRVFDQVQVNDGQLNVRMVARKGKGAPVISAIRVTPQ